MSDLFDKLKQGVASVSNNLPQGKTGLLGAAGVGGLLGALFGGSKNVQRTAKNVAVIGGSAAANRPPRRAPRMVQAKATATKATPDKAPSKAPRATLLPHTMPSSRQPYRC